MNPSKKLLSIAAMVLCASQAQANEPVFNDCLKDLRSKAKVN